ncbi:RNA-directed DNA polymerase from mobile element jockey [Holothuria leucospilota]|uniref:RNA-directed DNA polymerase from mobile element jockey n=1 Tax=Holothuria leucospilota TaxID=206669 RepID=A0A9Q1BY74_HOLLE|nr:RNA-directed DNA polymerase from mobile element jockey [Holothuria leucospilota]
MNDISLVSKKAEVVLFADDTNIFFTGNDPYQLENNVVNELSLFSDWFIANKLSLDISKTNFIVFNNTHHHVFNISINGQKLEPAKSVKFLGVIIDCKLTWQEHINHISSKIAKGIRVIGRLRHLLPKGILRTIYLTLVYPHLMYCSTVLSGTKTSYLHKLVLLQKRVIRYISLSGPRDHTSELYRSLNLLKLFDMINLKFQGRSERGCGGVTPPNIWSPVGKFSVCRQKGERERKRRGKEERRKKERRKRKERE